MITGDLLNLPAALVAEAPFDFIEVGGVLQLYIYIYTHMYLYVYIYIYIYNVN